MPEKWVVVLDVEPCAIGPFNSYEDAASYKHTDWQDADMRTMELRAPMRNWRKGAVPRR